jgi:hypothetical protein
MSLITGSGRVNLLSVQIRCYRVGFGSATWCMPMNPLGRGAGRLDRVGMRVRVEASWAAPNLARSRFPIKKFFFFLFQICFVNYKSI